MKQAGIEQEKQCECNDSGIESPKNPGTHWKVAKVYDQGNKADQLEEFFRSGPLH